MTNLLDSFDYSSSPTKGSASSSISARTRQNRPAVDHSSAFRLLRSEASSLVISWPPSDSHSHRFARFNLHHAARCRKGCKRCENHCIGEPTASVLVRPLARPLRMISIALINRVLWC